jgi:hypothetical protein
MNRNGLRRRLWVERHFVWLAIVFGVVFYLGLVRWMGDFIPEDAAVQQINYLTLSGYKVPFEGRSVMWYGSYDFDLACQAIRERKSAGERVVLILGPSHLHSIVEGRPGDRYAVWYANEAALKRGARTRYLQLSEANLSTTEMFALVLALREANALPDSLLVAFSHINLNVGTVRHSIQELCETAVTRALATRPDDPNLVRLRDLFGRAKREHVAALKRNPTLGTPQERLEGLLVRWSERAWPAYRKRNIVNAFITYRWVTGWRNLQAWTSQQLSRHSASMQAAVPPPQWQVGMGDPAASVPNLRALDAIVAWARKAGIGVTVYRVPFPRDYGGLIADEVAYDAEFSQLSNRVVSAGGRVLDSERLLDTDCFRNPVERRPGHPPLDYFHFQDRGHQLLGQAWDRALHSWGEAP